MKSNAETIVEIEKLFQQYEKEVMGQRKMDIFRRTPHVHIYYIQVIL